MKPPFEKAIIVNYDIFAGIRDHNKASNKAMEELNLLLADGWSIKHAYGMSGTQTSSAYGIQ